MERPAVASIAPAEFSYQQNDTGSYVETIEERKRHPHWTLRKGHRDVGVPDNTIMTMETMMDSTGITPAMAKPKVGEGSIYACGAKDSKGNWLSHSSLLQSPAVLV